MSKATRFVYAADSHGDMADPEALEALWAFCKDYKPDVRVAGGESVSCVPVNDARPGFCHSIVCRRVCVAGGFL